jgi:hypothetical protein
LERWNSVIERVLNDDIRDCDKQRISRESAVLTAITERMSIVVGADLKRRPLNHFSMISQPRYHEIAARHSVYHTVVLIRALAEQLDDVSHLVLIDPANDRSKPMPIPHMHEFFDFIHYKKPQILRKRRWP